MTEHAPRALETRSKRSASAAPSATGVFDGSEEVARRSSSEKMKAKLRAMAQSERERYWLAQLKVLREHPYVSRGWEGLVEYLAERTVKCPRKWPQLIARSEHDRLAWSVLESMVRLRPQREPRLCLGQLAGFGVATLDPLYCWRHDIESGRRQQRFPKGRPKGSHLLRNVVIVVAVNSLRITGTRPTVSNDDGTSDCHVVAEAFGLSYSQVRRIWRELGRGSFAGSRDASKDSETDTAGGCDDWLYQLVLGLAFPPATHIQAR